MQSPKWCRTNRRAWHRALGDRGLSCPAGPTRNSTNLLLVADKFGFGNCQTVAPPALGGPREGSAVAPRGTVAAQSSQAFRRQSAKAAAAGAETAPPPSVDDSLATSRAQSSRPINPAVTGRPGGQRSCPGDQCDPTERRIATATPPNRLTTQRRLLQVAGAMRTGAAMMRFGSNLYLTELIMVTLLLLGLIVVRSVGPVGEGGQ